MRVAHATRAVDASCVYTSLWGYQGSEYAWGNGDFSVNVEKGPYQ
jgi:hypothetical protein